MSIFKVGLSIHSFQKTQPLLCYVRDDAAIKKIHINRTLYNKENREKIFSFYTEPYI